MAQPKVKEFEVRFARAFLKYTKANEHNTYLLLAVIAWLRSESGTKYIGNNPLNLRPGNDIARYMSGTRKGPVGYFATFKNLDDAARATARRLEVVGSWAGYKPILAAARRGTGQDGGVTQAVDFLMAIAMSKWSADHYGWSPAKEGYWKTRLLPNGQTETIWVPPQPEGKNKLLSVWSGLTGQSLPKEWFTDPIKEEKKVIKPQQPRALDHVLPPPNYLQPYGASRFYSARPHQGQYVLPRD